ncbi:MAG: hypothetical protein JO353_11690, partial [Phycisphaerae bacterium]|nr:hypothetical protein [Phycisphaerae bacterium]
RRVLRDYLNLYEKRREAIGASPTQMPQLLVAECDQLTWSVAGDGMPDKTPTVQTLVTTAP